MIRRAFFAIAGLSAAMIALNIGLQAGPTIEARLAPIRGPQSIQVVERTPARLCWAWTFVKLRATWSDNLDAFLEIDGQPGGIAAPYDRDTGWPWGMKRFAVAPRLGPYTLNYCVALPPAVQPGDTVRVRQVAFYPGWIGLWRLPVPFPEVVSNGVPGLKATAPVDHLVRFDKSQAGWWCVI